MPKRKPDTDDDIVEEANKRYEHAKEYQADAHRHFIADMKFANADDENHAQWDDQASRQRRSADRPALTVNKTRVHCLQIINDARQNPVQIRINPVDDEATYEAAQIYEGIVRHIEYISNAQQAYANATYCQVMGGIGYWRVLIDYFDDESFDQEIFIRRIGDPTTVFLDPDMQQADGSDAKWGFIFYEVPREEFEREYGEHDDPDDPNFDNPALADGEQRSRRDDRHVELLEYYRVCKYEDRLLMLPRVALQFMPTEVAQAIAADLGPTDNPVVRESMLPKGTLKEWAKFGVKPIADRQLDDEHVEYYKIADNKIVERKDWPGRYIPIVRVPCEEIIIEGKLDWVSHVRHLRDPQRLYNWYTSQAAEFVALQTKAPYIAVAESVEPYKKDWDRANVENKSVLLYKGKDEQFQPIPPPQRAQPPVMAPAYIEGLKISQAEMMMATGQYQAVMGEPGNEVSGKAINARQRQGDNATYHVIDRLAAAIRFTGRILLDLIPAVYDRPERIIMIMGEDGSQTQVQIDPSAPQAHMTVPDPNAPPQQPSMRGQDNPDVQRAQAMLTIFNPNVGRYAVVADVGPSYATKRQESFNALSQIMMKQPQAMQVIGDFWAKNADFPGADELAVRLKKGLPPQYKDDGPDPQVMMLQQQLQHVTQTAQQLLQKADAEVAQHKAHVTFLEEQKKDKSQEIAIKDYEAETNRLKAVGQIDPMALQIVVRQLLQDMIQTDIIPRLHAHADIEGALQAKIAPPEPAGAEAEAGPMEPATAMGG